jgi:hypothetical protein
MERAGFYESKWGGRGFCASKPRTLVDADEHGSEKTGRAVALRFERGGMGESEHRTSFLSINERRIDADRPSKGSEPGNGNSVAPFLIR